MFQNADFTANPILPVNTMSPVANNFNVTAITFTMTGALLSFALAAFVYILGWKHLRMIYTIYFHIVIHFRVSHVTHFLF